MQMRTPRKAKQQMHYALLVGKEDIFVTDDNGNIVYQIVGGEKIPKKTGEKQDLYSEPVGFYNSISGQLTENELQAFGTQNMANAKMTYKRGEYPFKTGTLIWKQSEVKYLDKDKTKPDPTSADFRVIGIMNEGQYFWKCMLEALSNNETASKTKQ